MKRLLSVILLVLLSVVQCAAMSKSEIEDFSNFLRKTSALDQSLKDGIHFHDEDEDISEHAWEESGKFEGDLILNERQRRLIVEDVAEGLSRNGLKDSTKRWPNNEVVVYIQREHFSSDQVDAILEGIQDLARASCVKFRPYKKGDRDAVVIQGSRRGCFSQVGYQGGYQVLNLSGRHPVGRGCFRHGTVVHELLHTLGFYHMQSSPDRDDYIDVHWENIVEPAKHNFRKYNSFSVSDFGVGYDYDSVLHYSKRAFSSNGKPTLVPKQSEASIGQRIGLSDKDTKKLNKMYCDADSNNFDQDEPSRKPTTTKKKPKNLPFQGQGIGYHQGNTVVIKLPTAETIKLPEKSSYPYDSFDYFSKTSQTLPSPQAFVTEKKVTYTNSDKISAINNDELQKGFAELPEETYINFTPEEINTTAQVNEAIKHSRKEHLDDKNEAVEKSKDNVDNIDDVLTDAKLSDPKLERDLEEAFERLRKIVKARVYPSQSTVNKNTDVETSYNKNYNPSKENWSNPNSTNIDKFISSSLSKRNKENESHENSYKIPKNQFDSASNYHDANVEFGNPKLPYHTDYDSSYGTRLPHKQLFANDKKFMEQYQMPFEEVKLQDIKNRNDYRSMYNPNKKRTDLDSKEPHRLLGAPVPFKEPWYKVEEINSKYKTENDSPDPEPLKRVENLQDYSSLYKPLNEDFNYEGKPQSYFTFVEPVPINKYRYKTIKTKPYLKIKKPVSDKNLSDEEKSSVVTSPLKINNANEHLKKWTESPESYETSVEHEDSRSSEEIRKPERFIDKNDNNYIFKVEYIPQKSVTSPGVEILSQYSKEDSSLENDQDTEIKSYRVTENNNKKKQGNQNQDLNNKISSNSSDDDSSFSPSIDDRLKNILHSYTEYNDFDISSPYVGNNESSEDHYTI